MKPMSLTRLQGFVKISYFPGATDQEVGEAILSINYRDKLGNLKTLRGRTQELRIKKGEGVRTGELNAGQIATLMKQLKGRTRGEISFLFFSPEICYFQDVWLP